MPFIASKNASHNSKRKMICLKMKLLFLLVLGPDLESWKQ